MHNKVKGLNINSNLFFYTVFFLCLNLPFPLFSQVFKGRVESINGSRLFLSHISIKDSATLDNIFQTEVKDGYYSFILEGIRKPIIFEVTAQNYVKSVVNISNVTKKMYEYNFLLQKDEVYLLDEVIIRGKAPAIVINRDTVTYNVSSFKDGTERKIVDIIKKLPGIEVNDRTGEILYKGKSIETVNLEGDNLFGVNYSIATKNINVDMVEQVEAIENYSENVMLKDIDKGGRVALNLKLKKNRTDFSGNTDFGIGINSEINTAKNISANILRVSKQHKSFGTISHNNVGVNNSPFDYFTSNPTVEQTNDSYISAKKLISEVLFSSPLDDKRFNINNQLFGNYNNIFRVGKMLSIRTNLFYTSDVILFNQNALTQNYINNQDIAISDNSRTIKKPRQYRSDVEIKYNLSGNSLLTVNLKLKKEITNTSNNILQNGYKNFQSKLSSNEWNINQLSIFTKRISLTKALQVTFNTIYSDTPQEYSINPAIIDTTQYNSNSQFSNFCKKQFSIQSLILSKKNNLRFSYGVGLISEYNYFNSLLLGLQDTLSAKINGFNNDLSYKKISRYIIGNVEYLIPKWKIVSSLSTNYSSQSLLQDSTRKHNNNIIIDFSTSATYRLNASSGISLITSFSQKPFTEDYFFTNPVLLSNRNTVSNVPDLALQRNKTFGLLYVLNNLFDQFRMNFGIYYNERLGNYFSNLLITQDKTSLSNFYLPLPNSNFSTNFFLEKYISPFRGSVKFKLNYSKSNYKNTLNNSEIRNNTTNFVSTELFYKSVFNSMVNFEYNTILSFNRSQNDTSLSLENQAITNTVKFIFKPNKNLFFLVSGDYFLPNLSNLSQRLVFVDATIRYVPKNKRLEWYLTGKNLLNNRYFEQTIITDFSSTSLSNSLIPKYYLVNLSYNF